jgi:N-dimethylarginine dimethylaminohydrolase
VAAPPLLEKIYGRRVIPLKLVDPRFYHLDTALCPLSGGYLMYYPSAFAPESLEILDSMIPADKHIRVSDQDAAHFSCNAVELDGHVIMNNASPDLSTKLARAGFQAILTPLTEFLKAGGTAKCLTLKLVEAA